jgi:hypothetical protein
LPVQQQGTESCDVEVQQRDCRWRKLCFDLDAVLDLGSFDDEVNLPTTSSMTPHDVPIQVETSQVADPHGHHQQKLDGDGRLNGQRTCPRWRTAGCHIRKALRKHDKSPDIRRAVELPQASAIPLGKADFARVETPAERAQLGEVGGINFDPATRNRLERASHLMRLLRCFAVRPIEKEAQAILHGSNRDQVTERPEVFGPMAAMNQGRCILAQLELSVLHRGWAQRLEISLCQEVSAG